MGGLSKTAPGVPITKRALVQRLNRHLKKQGEVLKGSRGRGGDGYMLVDTNRNALIEDDVDLEKMGRELGVLRAYERLEGDT